MADAVDRDLPFLHGFEQRGLCARGRAVQLVCQKQIAENCARLIDQFAGLLLIDGIAGDIGRQNVRRKLHPAVIQTQRAGKG